MGNKNDIIYMRRCLEEQSGTGEDGILGGVAV